MRIFNKIKYHNFVIFFFIISCSAKNTNSLNQINIYGSWYLTTNQINYPKIDFNSDSTAIFNSRGDTVYRYKFRIENDILYLKAFPEIEKKAKILKINNDSLIFENLIENKEIQRYYKAR